MFVYVSVDFLTRSNLMAEFSGLVVLWWVLIRFMEEREGGKWLNGRERETDVKEEVGFRGKSGKDRKKEHHVPCT